MEKLIDIYSSPHLYHTREEASRYVKSFFEYHHIKVAKLQSTIVGVLFWQVEAEKHHGVMIIDELWIDEKFRRKGFRERLLRASLKDSQSFFGKDGYSLRKALVTTGEDNAPARKLYEKIGFQKSAVLKDLFGKGENELVYVLTLS